jgi:hypothetical protein
VLFAVFRTNCCSRVLIVSGKVDGHSGEDPKDKAQKKIMSVIICIYRKNYNLLYWAINKFLSLTTNKYYH